MEGDKRGVKLRGLYVSVRMNRFGGWESRGDLLVFGL